MAGEPLVEELNLDIGPALDALTPLGTALDDLVTGFSSSLADALSGALGEPIDTSSLIDTTGIATSIDTAVADATATPATIDLEGDTAPLTDAVDAATSAPVTIPVDADTTAAKTALDDISTTSVEIPVTADTAQAQTAIQDLGDAADQAAGDTSGGGGGGGVGGLSTSVNILSGASSAATADVSEVAASVKQLGGETTAAAIGGGAAFIGFLGEAAHLAADTQAENLLFANTFGVLADRVRQVDVGGLNLSLDQLAAKSGTASSDLEAAASRIGALGNSSGASADQITNTTDSILAMGATLSVTNPRLGDAATVSDTLTSALARGGRSLAQFGISLTSAQINARALSDTGKTTAADLTQFEKTAAGAELATQQFGDTLGTRFAQGAQNASVQLRAMKTEIAESISTLGQPLLSPMLTVLQDLVPVAISFGDILGSLAQIILPFAAALAPALAPAAGALRLVADGLGAVASVVHDIPPPLLAGIAVGITAIGVAAGAADGLIVSLGGAIDVLTGPIGIALGALALLGAAVDIFGSHASAASSEAKDLGAAMFSTTDGVTTFAAGISSAASGLAQFLAQQDTKGKINDLDATLKGSGQTLNDVATAVAGTSQQYANLRSQLVDTSGFTKQQAALFAAGGASDALIANLQDLSQGQVDEVNAALKGTQALDQQRDAFDKTAESQLQFLARTGQISPEQLAAAEATAHATTGVAGYGAALDIVNQIVQANTDKQQKNLEVLNLQNGKIAASVDAFNPATDSAAALTASLEGLGVSSKDAATFSKDLTDQTTASANAMIFASPTAVQLAKDFAAGNISAADYEKGLFKLGATADSLSGQFSAVNNAITSFVENAGKLAPSIDSELTAVEQGQSTAQKAADSAIAAQGKTTESIQTQIEEAYAKIAQAHELGGKKGASAVQSAEQALETVVNDGKIKTAEAVQTATEANLKLIAAADPQRLIDAEQKGLRDIVAFQSNLAHIVAQGGIDLAQSLAAQGPAIAGAQAAAFAQDPKGTKISEALTRRTDSAKTSYEAFLDSTFGPNVAATIEQQSNLVGSHWHPDLSGPTQTQLQRAEQVISDNAQAVALRASDVGQGGAAAYAEKLKAFPTASAAALADAQKTLRDGGITVQSAAAATGAQVTVGFGSGLKFTKTTAGAIADSKSAYDPQQTIDTANAARHGGEVIGQQFDKGIASGITTSTPDITAAATAAAGAAETAAKQKLGIRSPSQVGVEIGTQFVAGVAVGLSQDAPIVSVSQTAAATITSAFVGIGTAALGGLVQGFNDPTVLDAALAKLEATLANVTAAGSTSTAANPIGQIISSSVSILPTAQQAISQFSSTAASDLGVVTTATNTLRSAQARLTADQAKGADPALIGHDEQQLADVRKLSAAITNNLHDAEAKLATDRADKASKGQIQADELAVIDIRQQSLRITNDLHDAEQKLAHDRAGRTNAATLASDQATVNADKRALSDAQQRLAVASNPDTFIRNLQANTAEVQRFSADLTKLAGEGFVNLAEQLAQSGPDVAGKLADAFASKPAKAKLAEAAIDAANSTATAYQTALTNAFQPANLSTATTIGTNIGQAIATAQAATIATGGTVTAIRPPAALAVAPAVAVSQTTGAVQTLQLDLTVNLPDGTRAHINQPINVPIPPPSRLAQKVVAEVSAG